MVEHDPDPEAARSPFLTHGIIRMNSTAQAGRRGKDVRSDCWVQIAPATVGAHAITLDSKVGVLYGRSIRQLVVDRRTFFDIAHAAVEIEEAGARPYCIAARMAYMRIAFVIVM